MERAHTWPEVLSALIAGEDLDPASAAWAMGRIMTGEATPSQVAGFVVALQSKGVSVSELVGVADEMLAHARRIEVPNPSLDIVGTGGDRQNTVNISTMSAIVAAAAGITVVKHGNRAASSSSGTADCLEQLGVMLSLGPRGIVEVAHEVGITFCFAQDFHPSMRHAAESRRELGIPTVFNLLGPLTNPAQPTYAAVGVAFEHAAPLVAGVFADRGRQAAVFRGRDGLDELTVTTESDVWWVGGGHVEKLVAAPEAVGLSRHPLDSLRGGDAVHNAGVARRLLDGDTAGTMTAVRDAVLLNAGIALALTHGSARVQDQDTFVAALGDGVDRARTAIESGAAAGLLDRWRLATTARAASGRR
ncbi:anthranilate phosphoribosyltransferase [Mobilicoccus pelagius]|uniref:Anthranilate phosphoribosyltransferase n=1 Tax=Mobilicoccus pelagius NBRC 104925 TaxID=1089455 RepID=H5UUT6_9MICO|nr:anthranilate phosphoribosyltransferase [Mobilicoccus pelagius]GAB49494.1 anthranilate phosphoribosyltransferase [Mobilicoccus pelagius NBRC 104925]